FLPGLAERLLGESLLLPSVATWWCGQARDRQYVLEHLDTLRLGSAFELQRLRDSQVDDYQQRQTQQGTPASAPGLTPVSAESIQRQPYLYVGRETIALSTAPYVDEQQQLRSAPMTLRMYAAFNGEDFEVLPGGLARIATDRGDISKDVWVPNVSGRAAPAPRRPVLPRRSDKDLPSRTGDDLYWLGRYLERTEGAIRLYRALFRALARDATLSEGSLTLEQITGLLVTLGHLSADNAQTALSEGLQGVEAQLWSLLFDDAGAEGLASLLGNVQRTAGRLRSRLSSDTWRLFERLGEFPKLRWRVDSVGDLSALLEEVLERLAAVAGKTAENMTRSYGWRLLELGKRIERARLCTRLLRELALDPAQDDSGTLPLLLAIADSTITHRARYHTSASALTVIDLLLVDASNPRSVAYQINQMYPHLRVMPLEPREEQLSESHRILLGIQNELTLANTERLVARHNRDGRRAQLERLLKRVDQAMNALSRHISRTYFAHTRSPHR
ncbi:MAG: circularly permuted type 2 ATP-grasp protein, partial [Pseudomonadota bacterium]